MSKRGKDRSDAETGGEQRAALALCERLDIPAAFA
jgi:hypothetical protein